MTRRPALVTVSGMVGSGKSTTVARILGSLDRVGVNAAQWRFQRLPCITLRLRNETPSKGAAETPASKAVRGRGYRRTRLTMAAAMGQVVRIAAFRIYRRWRSAPECAIADRYFYDSFAHYDFSHPATRRYATVLARMVPRPDVAILLVASVPTIARRRPHYADEYIASVQDAYQHLRTLFPELIEFDSDQGESALAQVEAAILSRVVQ